MVEPAGGGNSQSQAAAGMMTPMLFLLGIMLVLMLNPGLRDSLSDVAGTVIEPALPFHESYFVPTVFIIGSSIMVVNTIIRSFFMDPLSQSHFSHRNKQISKQLREAQTARDTARAEKMRKLQMEMMPDQMAMQSAMMRPMMFTMIFIIAIFSWMANSVAEFRVDYVSVPWQPMWNMNGVIMWIFPAWVATYITMSAPLGRIIDRHIKILRYGRHPLIIAGETIPEPLLHLLHEAKARTSTKTRQTQRRSKDGPRKMNQLQNESRRGGNQHAAPPKAGTACPSCSSIMVSRTTKGKIRCNVCFNEWR
ncbi:MAG: EMC3/TMCO1 family protein [Candidatus Thalassarchaeaceae archaeon]|nr:EMC3/TMCO1 family protein [Candidatus Thalassarchaeaceae archaeon]